MLSSSEQPEGCTEDKNLAFEKPTEQFTGSSTATWDKDRAVDGEKDFNQIEFVTLSHTTSSEGGWWRVDLGQRVHMQTIKIYKGAQNYPLRDFTVEVYDGTSMPDGSHSHSSILSQVQPIATIGIQGDDCDFVELVIPDGGINGRFVQIVGKQGHQVSLSEVEVYDDPCASDHFDDFCSHELQLAAGPPAEGSCGCKAWVWGDPHTLTFDHVKYDAHAKGEAILAKSQNPNSSFEIHSKMKGFDFGLSGSPAISSGIAVKGAEADSPIIELSLGSASDYSIRAANGLWCPVDLYVDGNLQEELKLGQSINDSTPNVQMASGGMVFITYPGLVRIKMWAEKYTDCFFGVEIELLDCTCESNAELDLVGLLGNADGDSENDWMDHDGNPRDYPTHPNDYYLEPAFDYSKTWLINTQTDSLFTEFYYVEDEPYDPEIEDIFAQEPSEEHRELVSRAFNVCSYILHPFSNMVWFKPFQQNLVRRRSSLFDGCRDFGYGSC